MDKRVLELALQALEAKRVEVDLEIEAIQKLMKGGIRVKAATAALGRRRRRTAAERRAQSLKMKKIWAAKRAARASGKAAAKPKSGPRSAAARKAQSERMKAYWAKRKGKGAGGRKPKS